VNGLFAAIGEGTIDVNEIKEYILSESSRKAEAAEAQQASDLQKQKKAYDAGRDDILVLNAKDLRGLDYRMAKCCNPVFGDDVFGFVSRTDGIKIHRITCPNASRLLTLFPYRIQKVRWADSPSSGSFQATLRVTTAIDGSVLGRITDVVNSFKASLRSFNVNENRRSGTYEISLKILVPSNLELDKVVSQIRVLKGVIKVTRQ
jgi:GTP pyrophosphokinase